MSGKSVLILFLFIISNLGFTEIFKTSLFNKFNSSFTVKRDIFRSSAKGTKSINDFTQDQDSYLEKIKREKEETQNPKENKEMVTRKISYEGYILKDDIYYLLIKVNGEFFIGKAGEIIAEDIKILSGDKGITVIEIDDKEIQVNIREFEE